LGDIAAGTDYPAFRRVFTTMAVRPGGSKRPRQCDDLCVATIADATAYLVLSLVTGAATDMALGGRADFTIEVQPTADPAPEHALPLGSGAVSGSAFTSWTPDAACFVPANASQFSRRDLANTFTPVQTFLAVPVVPNDSWTYTKIQNVSASDRLLGRSTAGAGDIEEIACTAAARSILDDSTVAAIIATLFGTYVAESDYFATSTIVGWAASPTGVIYYRRLGNVVTVNFYITGTSNATSASFTLPYQLKTGLSVLSKSVRVIDNGATSAASGHCYMTSGSNVVTLTKSLTGDAWTNSGTKTISGEFNYICN